MNKHNKHLDRAKQLRSNQTDAEQKLWHQLRAHRFLGLKFKRQKPIGPYIVDFVCIEKRLVIEVDGGQHAERKAEDDARSAWIVDQGYSVLRFWNNEVLGDIDAVLRCIHQHVFEPRPTPPTPFPAGGSSVAKD